MWMGVGCPCPPVRNDIVTPRHLLFCWHIKAVIALLLLPELIFSFFFIAPAHPHATRVAVYPALFNIIVSDADSY